MQMPLRAKGWFTPMHDYLCSLYPSHKPNDGEASAYESQLREFPEDLVKTVVIKAPARWDTFFPSAGQMRREVEALYKAQRAAQVKRPEPSPAPSREPTPAAQRLIDQWAEEDRHRNKRPDGMTPRPIVVRRMRELFELIGSKA